jgi:toxin ParE1/3/4
VYLIHWKKQAVNDLIKIGLYIATDSPANADRMIDLIEAKIALLAMHPQMGRIGRKRGTREMVVHAHYFAIYRVLSKQVEVLRVKHTAKEWPRGIPS